MNVIEKAISQMESWADDPAHGYDQRYRWGEYGDFDCSAAVIQAWENAGVPVKSNGATYTGNMLAVFKRCGFEDVTSKINLSTGNGLVRGDVLLNITHHTAMFCGNGYEVEASGNEKGGITGGKPGDQTGGEFLKRRYRNFPWTNILRYTGAGNTASSAIKETGSTGKTYTVKAGDSLWSIAANQLGDGTRWKEIKTLNGLASELIHAGQVLKIPGAAGETAEAPTSAAAETCTVTLPLLKRGHTGLSVKALQTLLVLRGMSVDVDGSFGEKTESAVRSFQTAAKILSDGEVGKDTWKALIG